MHVVCSKGQPDTGRCAVTAARHLAIAPTEAELLADEIRAVCHQIDRRLDNRPGTAERGIYFWLWPPADLDADVLAKLHADAVAFLHAHTTETRTP